MDALCSVWNCYNPGTDMAVCRWPEQVGGEAGGAAMPPMRRPGRQGLHGLPGVHAAAVADLPVLRERHKKPS